MSTATPTMDEMLGALGRVDRASDDHAMVAAALDALTALGETVGVSIDRETQRKHIEQAFPDRGALDRQTFLACVNASAGAAGLVVTQTTFTADGLLSREARRAMPLVGLAIRDGEATVVIVREAGPRKIALERFGAVEWLSPVALSSVIGAAPDEAIVWLVARPLMPLSTESHGHHDHPSPIRRVASLLRVERDDVKLAVVYAAAVGIVSLIVPVSIQALVGSVAFGGLLQPVVVLSIVVLVGLGLAGALTAMQSWVVERIQRRVFARVSLDLAHRLPRVRGEQLDAEHGPELVNRFFDVLSVQKSLATLLVDGLAVGLATFVGMVILAFYHPILFAFDVILVACLALILGVAGRGGTKTAIEESKAKYQVAAWLEEMVRHPMTFRTAGGPQFARARAEDLLMRYLASRGGHYAIVFRQLGLALALQAIASAAILGIGGALVIDGKLTLGQLVASEIIVTMVVAGFAKLGKYVETTYDLLAAMDKLGHLVDLPLEKSNGAPLRRRAEGARVTLKGLAFAYDTGTSILRNVDLHVEPNRRIGIFGRNASGKSTLFDMLYALRPPTEGRILVDQTDLTALHPESWREHVALVREVEIFEGTVLENIRLGRPDVSINDVTRALEAVGLKDHVERLAGGLEARLTTGAPELSKGQAARLVIARAIAGKPRLLLVDEALDHLDPETKRAIVRTLFDRGAAWTLMVATHDTDVLRAADDVLVLDEGKLRPLRAGDLPV